MAWVLSPVLLAILIQLGSIFYCMRINSMLAQNKDMLETINRISYSVLKTEAAIESASDKDHKLPKETQEVSRWINDLATQSDFRIETLSVDKVEGKQQAPSPKTKHPEAQMIGTEDNIPSIVITLNGRGKYYSVAGFVTAIESYSHLIHVQNIDMAVEVYGKTDDYKCSLAFRIYLTNS